MSDESKNPIIRVRKSSFFDPKSEDTHLISKAVQDAFI